MSDERADHPSILRQYLPQNASVTAGDTDDDRGGLPFVAMLDLELTSGGRVALPYSMLLRVDFDPSSITLHFSMGTVEISGYRLGGVYQRLLKHSLATLAPSPKQYRFDEAASSGPVITQIRSVEPDG